MLTTPPLGLYIHMPWCVQKCPYCDFNSHALGGELPADDYIRALVTDLEADLPLVWGRTVGSVYIGGGTPSLFSAGHVDTLLSAVRARLDLQPEAEVTLEANPGTLEYDAFSAYAAAGVNRISLGVQSFDDALLRSVGRIHGSREVKRAVQSLRQSGVRNFNLDLMYGLPGQDRGRSLLDVKQVVEAQPSHVSLYQLSIEPNTVFANRPPQLPTDEEAWHMQQVALEMLGHAGYEQYEISAFALPGMQGRHNINYWDYGDFLAIGAGAHGKLTQAGQGRIVRYAKHRHPKRYLQGLDTSEWLAEKRELSSAEIIFEFFLNQLRLKRGFSTDHYRHRTGLDWQRVEDRVQQAVDGGLLEFHAGRIRTTALGWRFVNDIQQMFLPG